MVSCVDYDYVEIACLYRFHVRLQLSSGEQIDGHALDTKTDLARRECIEITQADTTTLVPIESIQKMHALTENKHFTTVRFS